MTIVAFKSLEHVILHGRIEGWLAPRQPRQFELKLFGGHLQVTRYVWGIFYDVRAFGYTGRYCRRWRGFWKYPHPHTWSAMLWVPGQDLARLEHPRYLHAGRRPS